MGFWKGNNSFEVSFVTIRKYAENSQDEYNTIGQVSHTRTHKNLPGISHYKPSILSDKVSILK